MDKNRRPLAVLVVLAAMTATVPGFAQQPPGPPPLPADSAGPAPAQPGVTWSQLSPEQQRVLSGFGTQWNTLPPERQQALAHGSERWLGMSENQRSEAQQRFSRWRSLPPDQRQSLRSRWQRFQSLPPGDQARVRENFRRFQQLPPERRQMLRERWHNASPAQRQQMVEHAREMRQMQPSAHAPAAHGGPPPHH
jgi:uncharacterized protein DUF3106